METQGQPCVYWILALWVSVPRVLVGFDLINAREYLQQDLVVFIDGVYC